MKLTQQNFKLNKSASIQREKEVIWKSVYFTLNENNKKWLKTVDKCKTKFETKIFKIIYFIGGKKSAQQNENQKIKRSTAQEKKIRFFPLSKSVELDNKVAQKCG